MCVDLPGRKSNLTTRKKNNLPNFHPKIYSQLFPTRTITERDPKNLTTWPPAVYKSGLGVVGSACVSSVCTECKHNRQKNRQASLRGVNKFWGYDSNRSGTSSRFPSLLRKDHYERLYKVGLAWRISRKCTVFIHCFIDTALTTSLSCGSVRRF